MLTIKKIETGCGDLEEIRRLYEDSFPKNERHPLDKLLNNSSIDGLAFYDGETFCGFIFLACANDVAHVLYFATEEALRGKGYGSEILRQVAREKKEYRIIVDIERDAADSENREQRVRRKNFYLRNGFAETPVQYRWRGEDYEILCAGGPFTDRDFRRFWEELGFVV